MVLHSGVRPVFFDDSTSHEAFLPYPDLTQLLKLRRAAAIDSPSNTTIFSNEVDSRLSNAWNAMSAFCSVANFAAESEQLISLGTYLDTMASVMYRLFRIRFEFGSHSEAIRLGLLAFCCSVFLQWKRLGLSYAHHTSVFKDCLLKLASTHTSSQLLLWLLMVGAVSLFHVGEDAWLKPLLVANMSHCDIDSWDKMQGLLNSFMWVSLVQDHPAKRVFEATIERWERHKPRLSKAEE
jgi:hypothetical protein